MVTLTVRKIGNSLGVILPQEALTLLHAKEGDELTLTPREGGAQLTPFDPDFARQMKIAHDLMGRYRNTLRELAK